jgi:hypothetical protein
MYQIFRYYYTIVISYIIIYIARTAHQLEVNHVASLLSRTGPLPLDLQESTFLQLKHAVPEKDETIFHCISSRMDLKKYFIAMANTRGFDVLSIQLIIQRGIYTYRCGRSSITKWSYLSFQHWP